MSQPRRPLWRNGFAALALGAMAVGLVNMLAINNRDDVILSLLDTTATAFGSHNETTTDAGARQSIAMLEQRADELQKQLQELLMRTDTLQQQQQDQASKQMVRSTESSDTDELSKRTDAIQKQLEALSQRTDILQQASQQQQQQQVVAPSSSSAAPIVDKDLFGATIVSREVTPSRSCRRNAIVYLAQKKHSSYAGKDSYGYLLRSLEMANKNYFSMGNNLDNMDLFIFHTNDFTHDDLDLLEEKLGFQGVLRLVNLTDSVFWRRPDHHKNDDPATWEQPMYSEGYRRMMHWYSIDIWDFFTALNQQYGCSYKYISRLDEESFLHSPIQYDIFDYMLSNNFAYGYRMCSYEMYVTKRLWTNYRKANPDFVPKRDIDFELCGFYNNFFVADLAFFKSPSVQEFLRFIDLQGEIYRRRVNDLVIQTMAVYAFAEPNQIHRFLDFTYEHSSIKEGCLFFGGIQAGYQDVNASATIRAFHKEQKDKGCHVSITKLKPYDLSPTYSHLPPQLMHNGSSPITLESVVTARLEQKKRGILSG